MVERARPWAARTVGGRGRRYQQQGDGRIRRPVRARSVHRPRSPWASQRPTRAAAVRWAAIIGACAASSSDHLADGEATVVVLRPDHALVGVLQVADPVAVDDGERRPLDRPQAGTGVRSRPAGVAAGGDSATWTSVCPPTSMVTRRSREARPARSGALRAPRTPAGRPARAARAAARRP